MPEYIVVLWTSGSLEEARSISFYLVENQIVACASLLPQVESIFHWEGKVQSASEVKILFKTRGERFEEVRKAILERCSYQVPEILALPIAEGHKGYLDWVDERV